MPELVTTNRNYQLPHINNTPKDDVGRIVSALAAIDQDMADRVLEIGERALESSLSAYILLSQKGAANGIAPLDTTGKLSDVYLPQSIQGSLQYKETWNAATNTPAIPAAAPGNNGDLYIVAVAGSTNINGITTWNLGDWLISNGTAWQRVPFASLVVSVAGRTGAVVLTATDITNSTAVGRNMLTAATVAAQTALLNLATQALKGLMAPTDKTKLDGIPDTGLAVKVSRNQVSAAQSITAAIPYDDTIPQSTEGGEVITVSHTPLSASNFLLIEVSINHSITTANAAVYAIFKDTDTDALAAVGSFENDLSGGPVTFSHYMQAGTVSQIDFKVRAGVLTGTMQINANHLGTRLFGGKSVSSITVTEFKG
jgi:hypothetical protein